MNEWPTRSRVGRDPRATSTQRTGGAWCLAVVLFASAIFAPPACGHRPAYRDDPDYLIDTWETEDGLPENSATAIAQTKDGHLWFGTFNGLVRFDGVAFDVWDAESKPPLKGSSVVNLHRDTRDRLWISTYEALSVKDDSGWRVVMKTADPGGDIVRTFSHRPNGDLLVTCFNGRVWEIVDDHPTELPAPPGRRGSGYLGHVDGEGQWWVAQDGFVGRWGGGQWIADGPPAPLRSKLLGAGPARDGGLWIHFGTEVRRYERSAETGRRTLPEPVGGFWSLFEDSRNNLWISTHDRGVFRLSPSGEFRRWTTTNGLSHTGARFVFEDREDNLWIGTSGGGLSRFKHRRFSAVETDSVVQSMAPHPDGGVWMALYGGGLHHLRDGVRTPVTGIGSDGEPLYARSVLTDRRGRTWLGTLQQGLWRSDGGEFRRILETENAGKNQIALFEDSRGRVWISGGGGVSVCDEAGFRSYGKGEGLPTAGVRCFAEDSAGTIWVTNLEAVYRLMSNRFTEVRSADDLPLRHITSLMGDAGGDMWMGTAGGEIRRWRAGTVARIGREHGLPIGSIQGLVRDEAGFVWMPSSRGVLRVAHAALHAVADGQAGHLDARLYNLEDGLPGIECTSGQQPLVARDARGRLWFSTLKGAAMADPNQLRSNEQPPLTRIEGLSYLPPQTDASQSPATRESLHFDAPFIAPLVLPAGSRRIEIRYAAPSFVSPERIRFAARLEGLDEDWRDLGQRRVAYFDELPPGAHRFRVRAANEDGIWDESGAELAFVLQPFLWQTTGFQASLALVLLATGAALHRLRSRARLQRTEERERAAEAIRDLAGRLITAQEAERSRVARELHDGLSQSLALLSVELEMFGRQPSPASGAVDARMREFSAGVKDLSSEVHRLSHELHPAKLEQLGLIAALRGFCHEFSTAHRLAVIFLPEPLPAPVTSSIALCLFRVAQEALQNVAKHSDATRVHVELAAREGDLLLRVTDDGRGFDVQSVRVNGSLGLVSMQERVRLARGHVVFDSTPGRGTRVEAVVPMASVGTSAA